jgi:hypothetical protein
VITIKFREFARAWTIVVFLIAGVAAMLVSQVAKAEEKEPASKAKTGHKLHLTPANAGQLLEVVRPHDDEWRHLKVQWLTDVVAARKRAAAEDKPILICYTGGAGYNEPLGVC